MKDIVNLLFEAGTLKNLPRSGYHFLGAGRETVAEHCFMTTFFGFILGKLVSGINRLKLLEMCLVHDLGEARTGDLNYVQKKYVIPNESVALRDATRDVDFGDSITDLVDEFNNQNTPEARLAHDADQLAFILDLKSLSDLGYRSASKWLPNVVKRLKTDIGHRLAQEIRKTEQDAWWLKNYIDTL